MKDADYQPVYRVNKKINMSVCGECWEVMYRNYVKSMKKLK